MSAKATGIVWESDLPRAEKYILAALADHAKEDGSDVRPSIWRIEWKTGYSETQIRAHLINLRKKRILVLTHQGGKFDGDVNVYRIDYAALPMLPDFKEWSAQKREEEKKRKGTESAPSGVRKSTPQEGTVQPELRVRKSEIEGTVATAPKPSTNRTKSIIEGNSASELPGQFALEAEKTDQNPKPKTQQQDQRFPEICEAIRKCWPKGEGYKCDISQADAGCINRMLANRHDWKAEELSLCIAARFMSASVNPTESVKRWIGAVTDYQSGPQDKYGNPLYTGSELNHWRNQARTMLYGPQPEQMPLKAALPDELERESKAEYEARIAADQQIEQQIENLKTLPLDQLEPLKQQAEEKFELKQYKSRMPASNYLAIVLRSIVKMRSHEGVT